MVPWTCEMSKHSIRSSATGQFEGFLEFLQGLGTHREVTGATGLVEFERVLRVFPDGGQERCLVSALGHPDIHPGTAQSAEPLREFRRVAGFGGHEDLPGQPALHAGLVTVDLLQQVFDEFRGGGVLDFFHDPAALAPDPAAADVEDLDGGLELVFVQGEDVGVRALREDHGVAFEDLLQGHDVVPEPRSAFVVELGHGGGHFPFQPVDEWFGFAAHEGAEVLGQCPVVLGGDSADAGCGAFVDVAEQAGPAAGLGAFEHAGAAAADGEHPQQGIHGVPDGAGRVGAEIPGPLAPVAAQHLDAGQLLPHRDRQVRVALVVPEHHVEPGREFLDPRVFQLQRLQFAAHHCPFDAAGGVHHRVRLRASARQGWRSRNSAGSGGSWPCRHR